MAQAFGRFLTSHKKTGNIVNTASMSGTIVNIPQGRHLIIPQKAGVVHLTKSLAVEWASRGIRVNSISPGYIRTEMTGTVRQDWQDYWVSTIPFGRMGTPDELAGAVIYLLSDASTYTSGLDGDRWLLYSGLREYGITFRRDMGCGIIRESITRILD